MYPICFYKDRIMPVAEAHVSLDDLGLLRGYGIFDFLRTYNLRPFLLEHYMDRFYASAEAMQLKTPLKREELMQTIHNLLIENKITEDVGIRLIMTGGPSEDSVTVFEPLLYVVTEPLHPQPPGAYAEGVKLIRREYLRTYPHIKTINYLVAVRNYPEVKAAGVTDILYTWQGEVLETTRNNFFVVKNGVLTTAKENILIGRTRNFVISLAKELQIPIEERAIGTDELSQSQEAFITGTTKSITPVVKIDELTIGIGKPGPITERLMRAFKEKCECEL